MRKRIIGAALAGLVAASPAHANLNIFACEPEWGALSSELGGDKVSVYTATTGLQDPHQIQARPSLIAKARAADISVCTGAELEIGWLPMIDQQSSNDKIQPGGPGDFQAAAFLNLLEQPTMLDRSQGDVHAAGNPHIQTDPRNIPAVAPALTARFAQTDPANAAYYNARLADFMARWQAALAKWQTQAAPLRGVPVLVSHNSWVYLEGWLGLVRIAPLEPKPGVPASSGYLAQIIEGQAKAPAKLIIRAAYEDDRAATFIAQKTGIPVAVLPFTVGGTPGAKDLFSLYDDTITILLGALKSAH